VFTAMPLNGAIVNYVKGVPRVPARIDFERSEVEGFNTEDLLKPGLSVKPEVKVRWLSRQSNSILVGPVFVPDPMA
jgi:hypothetical protein